MPMLDTGSYALITAICEAYGLNKHNIARIVLDVSITEHPIIYVQYIGDEHKLEIDWADIKPFIRYAYKGEQDA